ncbi:PDR/VanB family oxidoreductase [Paraburkholderia sartisoli]|uniref:Vanillate O-demethylase ferredoxin subunit n=1 Tax=Paraburkholderia sartisoli TaxID=83784 RepID=A0A1H4D652_9BURK|nr:PDR/VanB family oxidoreductase [Paraburkholderia sartisoli]SEA68131.1 vanillate O-demethylase ferredoxin subunit [Paraburkholderia sartisoli]
MNHSRLVTARVARRHTEAEGIVSFELVSVDGGELPAFEAGAHIDVHIPGGLVRQYSLCNPPMERHRYQIAVLRDDASRGGSAGMHDAVHEGDEIQISAPRNHFAIAQGHVRHLLFAGGIGLTPLLCMAEQLSREGAAFSLHYCARSSARAAFVERIAGSRWADQVRCHFDDAGQAQRIDLDALLADPQPDLHLYVCGPQGFMNAVLDKARSLGWPADRLHYEYFAAAPALAANVDEASFDIRLARSGRVVPVQADQTVTQALAAAGVEVPVSCGQGICGTCLTRVLDGEPDHRDLYLSPDEQARNDQFLPCCSRAKSRMLVLDL